MPWSCIARTAGSGLGFDLGRIAAKAWYVHDHPSSRSQTSEASRLCGLLRGGWGVLNYRGVGISSLFRPSALGGVDRIVIDHTGLQGVFDIDLTWAVDSTASPDAPSIFTAVQEQLGLRLNPTKAPLEVLVIEGAQRPSPD